MLSLFNRIIVAGHLYLKYNRHKKEIEEICQSAKKELELELKLRVTEEEWTEQVSCLKIKIEEIKLVLLVKWVNR